MPSIPQSLLWLSLVVLWLFVLVPMLVSKRDAVRRTSDVALATRVLNSATAARLIKRGRPAAGHRSDPDWQPEEDEYDEETDDLDEDEAEEAAPSRVVTVAAAVAVEETTPGHLDFDGVDPDSAELPLSASAETDDETPNDTDTEIDLAVEYDDEGEAFDDDGADQYEYIDDTSGIPIGEEPPMAATPAYARRHRYDADTAAAVSARKFAFRRRMLMIMALMLVGSAATAFLLTSSAWWFCGMISGATVLYLGYLRRQTRIEERVRRRRMQRMARSQLGVENTYDREYDVVPSRLRRPGAVVLEIDDEDPIFEHLDYAPYAREYDWDRVLPRAVGQ
jgi:hypothetical protein